MESDNANVEKYINLVRNRAYKSEAGSHIYKASDFLTNELAILHEKDKEFVQEGQRWWDLCRMKNAKDGIPLVFCIEGDIDNKVAIHNQESAPMPNHYQVYSDPTAIKLYMPQSSDQE